MLKKTFEWCRIFTARPDDELVSKRQLATKDLIEHLDDSSNENLLFACTEGVIRGFTYNSEAVKTILTCIRNHQPAFPADLSENALELRVCAMLALGEIVTRPINDDADVRESATLFSALLISGLGLRPKIQEKFLSITLDELYNSALSVANQIARSDRQRIELDMSEFPAVSSGADPDKLWKELRPVLRSFFANLQEQAAQDREELQVLWWLYNNFSEIEKKPLSTLRPFEAALCCGVELGDLVRIPSLEGVRQMVKDAVTKNRNKKGLQKASLSNLIGQWTSTEKHYLVPKETESLNIVNQFPSLLPLTWICSRLINSGTTTGWEEEFEIKTGFSATENFDCETISVQVFNERIAQRISSNSEDSE